MDNFKYLFEKNKQKILLAISLLFLFIICITVFLFIKKNNFNENTTDVQYGDVGIKKAEYILTGTCNGKIDLIKTSNQKVVDSLQLSNLGNTMYSRDPNLKKLMVYNNSNFYSIEEKKGKIIKNNVYKLKDNIQILNFNFSDNYIVFNSNGVYKTISLKENKENYINEREFDNYVVSKDNLIYSKDNFITSLNLKINKVNKTINLGDKTKFISLAKNGLTIFNNFGYDNNKSIILEVNPNTLYINGVYKLDNNKVLPVTQYSGDLEVYFMDKVEKDSALIESHYAVKVDSSTTKTKTTLSNTNKDSDKTPNTYNTVSAKGYLYSNEDLGELKIFELRSNTLIATINTDKIFFMPILK
ncbi:hypothetical protein KGF51_12205 [Clostridioides sp. ZZV14-6045]|uniref:hypothetical protein n=1 Tax=Clostridioides sp. ZZV14-6045 TaxID=2811489 RepID=UPI001D12D899|nr:hypothetical protein [Clostridioides sp. ZZV14-6045]